MSRETEIIERFYTAFQQRDAAAMGRCYHDQARFDDPAFPGLDAAGVRAMWSMLCARGKDLRVDFRDVRADGSRGSAHWEAWYTFSASGRPVHNVIDAEFEFRDGLILRHVDRFDFHRWAAQALGLPGKLLGGTGFLKRKVQAQAAKGLADWRSRN
ncbi:MAG: nuclear transport factor 2 family protein [Sinimarinibacterium sp.]|jgi:ketosteroid isomerase-like protein